ncbi:MAG: lipoyl(octanoyl) transferase LipB [Dehalococcoidia bacterium]|nr:lipoyl(octanoyl) transferase LipB [Dehalococcoidia bacterium]
MPERWRLLNLGLMPYREAWAMQTSVVEDRIAGRVEDTLILVEHPPIITLGAAADMDQVLASTDELARQGVELIRVNRGGNVTYHGPGQLVGYPIIDLSGYGGDVHLYVRRLEQAIMALLAGYGIQSGLRNGYPGVWVDEKKIAARGVYIKRWVTMHGFSLNVQPDLSHFSLINPCGIVGCQVTSMARELEREVDQWEVRRRLAVALGDVFSVRIEEETGESVSPASGVHISGSETASPRPGPGPQHCPR